MPPPLSIELVAIDESVSAPASMTGDAKLIRQAARQQARSYKTAGYRLPWVGYWITESQSRIVGICSFKGAPKDRRVEISCQVFEEETGRGIATEAVKALIRMALEQDPRLSLTARTLPVRNAAGRVLEKAGFRWAYTVIDPSDGAVWEWIYRNLRDYNTSP